MNGPLTPDGVKARNLGYSTSVTVNLPVWDWLSTEHKVKQSEIRRDAARVALTDTQRRLIAELQTDYAAAQTAQGELDSLDTSVATAAESLRLSELRYKSGEALVLEVVDAQNAYVSAENAREDGYVRYQNALATLQTLTGQCEPMKETREMGERFPKGGREANQGTSSWLRAVQCGAAIALSAAVLGVAGCKKQAPPETVVTVQAEHPERGAISEHVIADAVLAPQAQSAITPKITAPISKFYVQRGARVKAGELLATLENADLAAAAMDNKGTYEAAQAAYDTATKAQVPQDAQKAELDLAQAKANLALNESIVKARTQLLAEGAIPARDLDTAQAALVQAQAAYDTAASQAEAMKKVTHAAELKTAQGQLTSAEGKYKNAAAMVGYSEIRSPIDGYVTDRPLYAGEMAPQAHR